MTTCSLPSPKAANLQKDVLKFCFVVCRTWICFPCWERYKGFFGKKTCTSVWDMTYHDIQDGCIWHERRTMVQVFLMACPGVLLGTFLVASVARWVKTMGLMSGMFLRVDIFGVTMDTYGLYNRFKRGKTSKIEFNTIWRHWCDGNQLKVRK